MSAIGAASDLAAEPASNPQFLELVGNDGTALAPTTLGGRALAIKRTSGFGVRSIPVLGRRTIPIPFVGGPGADGTLLGLARRFENEGHARAHLVGSD